MRPFLLLVLALGLIACPEGGGGGPDPIDCPAGRTAYEGSCVPDLLADCAPLEVPLKGGGCQRVGVQDGACEPGFVADAFGGCEPVLPDAPCADGRMAVPGEDTCAPVASCPAGPWPEADPAHTPVYVDAAASGTGADGSMGKPYKTLLAALGGTGGVTNPQYLLAPGSYAESIVLDRPLRLTGLCPDQVEVVGVRTGGWPAVTITGTKNVTVEGIAITGNFIGVGVLESTDIHLENLYIHDVEVYGVTVRDKGISSTATGKRLLIERARDAGVWVDGSSGTFEDLHVKQTRGHPDDVGTRGFGVSVRSGSDSNRPATLTLKNAVVEGSRMVGVNVLRDVHATLEGVVVRDTLPQASDGRWGFGMNIEGGAVVSVTGSVFADNLGAGIQALASELTLGRTVVRDTGWDLVEQCCGFGLSATRGSFIEVYDSVFRGNHTAGIIVTGSKGTLDRLVLRDTLSDNLNDSFGTGLLIQGVATERPTPSDLKLTRSLSTGNLIAGITMLGGALTLSEVHVTDIRPSEETGLKGAGVVAQPLWSTGTPAVLAVEDSLIEGAYESGMLLLGVTATVKDTVIRNTAATALGKRWGDGITISTTTLDGGKTYTSEVLVGGVFIEGSERAGVAVFGSTLELSDTRLGCNGLDLNIEDSMIGGENLVADIVDGGGNTCGCGADEATCQAASASLEAAPPPSEFEVQGL